MTFRSKIEQQMRIMFRETIGAILLIAIAVWGSPAYSQSTDTMPGRYDFGAPSALELPEMEYDWARSDQEPPFGLPTTASTYLDNS
ncbi:MAG: hypothetical protein ACR2OL_14085, partial [Anderseniella sp.]